MLLCFSALNCRQVSALIVAVFFLPSFLGCFPPFLLTLECFPLIYRVSQGREASQDEIGASALLAKEMDDKLNDAAVQV